MERGEDVIGKVHRYESYVRAAPGNPLLWMNLGDLYHKLSRFDEAIACFERCLHEDTEYTSARSNLAAVMISQHRFAEAERLLRGLLEQARNDPVLLFNLGVSLYYQKHWSKAELAFTDAQARGLATPESYAYRARCRHYAGDMEHAIQFGRKWVETANDAESRGYLALLYMDQGNLTEARQLAQQVLLTHRTTYMPGSSWRPLPSRPRRSCRPASNSRGSWPANRIMPVTR
jgi:tetratricopeptide (TPR) repeat protein